MDLHHAFEVLEIQEGTSLHQIKQAYRDLALIWHPDHHAHNPRLQRKALEKMKELNAAYDCIRFYLLHKTEAGVNSRSATPKYEEKNIITCPACGAKNRVTIYGPRLIIRCGQCGYDLFPDQKTSEEDDWEQRTLCGDSECIGIIGPNGRCTKCGKTLEEGKKADEYKTKLREERLQKRHKKLRNEKRLFYIIMGTCCLIFTLVIISKHSRTVPARKLGSLDSFQQTENGLPPSIQPTRRLRGLLNPSTPDLAEYPLNDNDYFTKSFFKKSGIDRESIAFLQQNLSILGYHIGQVDGIAGRKTLAALKQFSNDFRIKLKDDFANDLLKTTAYHAVIAAAHPDWRNLAKSGELGKWLSEQSPSFARQVEKVLKVGDPHKIITLINYYKFEKEKPSPLPLPENGIYRQHFAVGIAPLKIITRDVNQHHYIKLVSVSDNRDLVAAFVRGGTALEIKVPLGRYELRYAVGETWFGENFLFGPNTIFSKADTVLEFEQVGYQVSAYSLELFLQPYGNLRTQEISAFDF